LFPLSRICFSTNKSKENPRNFLRKFAPRGKSGKRFFATGRKLNILKGVGKGVGVGGASKNMNS
jgi:hypothetical protein